MILTVYFFHVIEFGQKLTGTLCNVTRGHFLPSLWVFGSYFIHSLKLIPNINHQMKYLIQSTK